MDPRHRHQRLSELFAAAINQTAEEQRQMLASIREDDPQLAADLAALLSFDHSASTVSARTIISSDPPAPERWSSQVTRYCPTCGSCLDEPTETCPHDNTILKIAFDGPRIIDRRYRCDKRLGGGGMGEVFLVYHLGLERHFALKLMRRHIVGADFLAWFEREARSLGHLKHPHIVDVTDYGVDPRGFPYLVMEFLDGVPLDQILKDRKRLSVEDALKMLGAVAEAVDFAHEHDILHCDLKPSNIYIPLVDGAPGFGLATILDFGLARLASADAASAGPLAGTPSYMSPELFAGAPPSRSSDIYAFGAISYLVLTGKLPFGDDLREAAQRRQQPCPLPSTVAPDLPTELDIALVPPLSINMPTRPGSAVAVVKSLMAQWHRAQWEQWKREQLPKRAAIACAIGLIITLAVWLLRASPPLRSLELALIDLQFRLAPSLPPNPRLLLVSIDEASLKQDARPLAQLGDAFGIGLDGIANAGARHIGIDLLLPEQWGSSPQFARFLAMHHSRVTLAVLASGDTTIGVETTSGLAGALLGNRASNLFAFVNVFPDADGVVRHTGSIEPAWASRVTGKVAVNFLIDHRIDRLRLQRLSWKDVALQLSQQPEIFRDKIVLLGAEFEGTGDRHLVPTPTGRQEISGLELQALIAGTLLERRRIREFGPDWTMATITGIVVAVLLLCHPRLGHAWAGMAAFLILYGAISFSFFLGFGYMTQLAPVPVMAAVTAPLCYYLRRFVFAPIPVA